MKNIKYKENRKKSLSSWSFTQKSVSNNYMSNMKNLNKIMEL